MIKKTVLIIDDDVELTELLKSYLSAYAIDCLVAHNGRDGIRQLRAHMPDLVILDIMLPDQLGFDICKAIRECNDVPIVMLSARGQVYDRILGLELGADDYLPKPFEPRELVARIESVLRRHGEKNVSMPLRAGDLLINPLTNEVTLNNHAVDLTHLEFTCLLHLVRNRYRILSRDQLLGELRGLDWEMENRSVDILISRIRKKLGDNPKHPHYIATIRGSGYRYIGDKSRDNKP